MNLPLPDDMGLSQGKEVTEEELREQVAYYKARLMDIEKAPPHSRHRDGWAETRRRLHQCQRQLKALQHRHRPRHLRGSFD